MAGGSNWSHVPVIKVNGSRRYLGAVMLLPVGKPQPASLELNLGEKIKVAVSSGVRRRPQDNAKGN